MKKSGRTRKEVSNDRDMIYSKQISKPLDNKSAKAREIFLRPAYSKVKGEDKCV